MSKITEYLKLIPKGLPNSKDILESIVNNVKLKMGHLAEDIQEEVIRRRVICENCPFISKNATTSPEYQQLTGRSYKTVRNDAHCSFCGCEIKMRTASMNSDCGVDSWNAIEPEKQIPLKWTKFERNG